MNDLARPSPPSWPNQAKRYGYCECGCGLRTNIFKRSWAAKGHVKGEPKRFINGHSARRPVSYEIDEATGCWNWSAGLGTGGYGQIGLQGWTRRAHRYMYILLRGPIPDDLTLDHLCRNRRCVNPDHLEPVTVAENCRRGSATKLTWTEVEQIRQAEGTQQEIADRFGVSQRNVSTIRQRGSWTTP